MTPQAKMKATLERSGIPHKEIRCYGSQIVVTSWSDDAARQWASLLAPFAKVSAAAFPSYDEAKENKGTCLKPSMVKVWRTFATV